MRMLLEGTIVPPHFFVIARVFLTSCFIFIMSSCASVQQPAQPTEAPTRTMTWEQRQQSLNHLRNWQLQGKIAVRSQKESGSATLSWSQRYQAYAISLLGPFGSQGMILKGQPGQVLLQTANGARYHAKSPEQLLAEKWGYHLPVSSMIYWVRGLPVPGTPSRTMLDRYHRLTSLYQQGWNIQYLSYINRAGIDLPERLSITNASLNVKIFIYNWQIR
jgi:outer membrane lipoprotein LolB